MSAGVALAGRLDVDGGLEPVARRGQQAADPRRGVLVLEQVGALQALREGVDDRHRAARRRPVGSTGSASASSGLGLGGVGSGRAPAVGRGAGRRRRRAGGLDAGLAPGGRLRLRRLLGRRRSSGSRPVGVAPRSRAGASSIGAAAAASSGRAAGPGRGRSRRPRPSPARSASAIAAGARPQAARPAGRRNIALSTRT